MWVRAWINVGLDYYQAHYYPGSEAENRGNLAQQLASLPPLDKPLWLGELPARRSFPLRLLFAAKPWTLAEASGLCGAAVWRWTRTRGAKEPMGLPAVSNQPSCVAWSRPSRKGGHRSA